jgi:glycosyltransferase involved in cell wall biosynthesis
MTSVSVIITTFNRDRYLAEAIRSVIDQSYSDLEIIVVDDGSSDNTREIVNSFQEPRLRYIYQENQGRSAARNQGLRSAQGEYISFLDDDDYLLSGKIEQQVKFLEGHKDNEFVSSGAIVVDENGKVLANLMPWQDLPHLDLKRCVYSCPLLIHGVLIPRHLIYRLGNWFDPTLEPAEDTDFFIRLFYHGATMAWLPKILVAYRIHSTSSQGNSDRYSLVNRLVLDKIFRLPDLPKNILLDKDQIYAAKAMKSACQSFAYGNMALARQELINAADTSPALLQGHPPKIIFYFSDFAGSIHVRSPMDYIDNVFDNLPDSLSNLKIYRKEAKSAYFMKKVFSPMATEIHPSIKDWTSGVYYSPHWLVNRGVWSILFKIIFLELGDLSFLSSQHSLK